MTRSKLNSIIDALLLLCIAAMAGIGLLMKYVLVPGYQRWEMYNRNVELFFFDLSRHDWGAIHFIIGLMFLGLLIPHVILHWGMVVGTYSKLIPNRLARWVITVILIFLTILLFVFPYFVEPEIQERGPGKGRGYRRKNLLRNQIHSQFSQRPGAHFNQALPRPKGHFTNLFHHIRKELLRTCSSAIIRIRRDRLEATAVEPMVI